MKKFSIVVLALLAATAVMAAPGGDYHFDTNLHAPSLALKGATGDNMFSVSTGAANLVAITGAGAISAQSLSASGAMSMASLAVSGASHFGAANTVSTVTAAGDISAGHNLSAANSISAGGSVTAAAVNISGSGQLLLGNATSAGIAAMVPGQAAGALIFNSTLGALCQSTGTAVGAFVYSTATATACY